MKWQLIESGFCSGCNNMQFDIALANNCPDEEAFFRLYQWHPYCISLGANQNPADINQEKAAADGIEIVKRPTGGRAILHAEEITYSIVIPVASGLTSTEIYKKVSQALVRGLKLYSPKLAKVELENRQPDFAGLLKEPSGLVCFASTAKSEVKYESLKLIGSAQRKMNRVILQHGSILCGSYHMKLIDYLRLPAREVELIKEELQYKTTDISSITGNSVDYSLLSVKLIQGFEQEWGINLTHKPMEVSS